MNKGIFITGTDTGVGKTYVACGIAAELRKQGIDVGVMKPAETGCRIRKGALVPSDAIALARAAGSEDLLDFMNPYRFREPVAPAVAAAHAGKTIALSRIMRAFRKLCEHRQFMIVEGSGGILVPLTGKRTFSDLAERMRLPVVIVARPGLGTINHTLLTIMALKSKGITIQGVVINDMAGGKQGVAERTNPSMIESISGVPVLGRVRRGQHDCNTLVRNLLKGDS